MTTTDLKRVVWQAEPTTKAARLRSLMPDIECRLAEGVQLGTIHKVLAVPASFATLVACAGAEGGVEERHIANRVDGSAHLVAHGDGGGWLVHRCGRAKSLPTRSHTRTTNARTGAYRRSRKSRRWEPWLKTTRSRCMATRSSANMKGLACLVCHKFCV
jgi:hypothetical protein